MSNKRGPKSIKKHRDERLLRNRRRRRVKGYVKVSSRFGNFDYPGSKEYVPFKWRV
jgi:hypothetical protein